MPKIGNKTFPYTKEGKKKANILLKKKKMSTSDGYMPNRKK